MQGCRIRESGKDRKTLVCKLALLHLAVDVDVAGGKQNTLATLVRARRKNKTQNSQI